ncbi:hypothetical protein RPYSC3_44540 [Rhodopseudomonas palustris]|nr:hypothetical protein RPYSC3_44540 [Rhodopseudomonas palustris]
MVQRMNTSNRSDRPAPLFRAPDALVRATLAAACVVAGLMLTLQMASAQDRGAAREACKADYQKLCNGVSPGGGRIKKCLNDNFSALSDPCKQALGGAEK